MNVLLILFCGGGLIALAWKSRMSTPTRDAHFATRHQIQELTKSKTDFQRLTLGFLGSSSWRRSRTRITSPPRDSVLIVGPTQSGKTSSLVIPSILGWDGPVIAASVKDDLVVATQLFRKTRGPLGVLDPSSSQNLFPVRFDPVALSNSWERSRRIAMELASSAADARRSAEAMFWGQLAGKFLAPLLLAAAVTDGDLGLVTEWVNRREESEPLNILEHRGHANAADAWASSLSRDERQLSSVYATVEALLEPLQSTIDRRVPPIIPSDFLRMSGTLYLCAPAHDQQRFRSLFTATTSEVLAEAFRLARSQGGQLVNPLLVVLDEAAAIAPLEELDVIAATCASHGITLVTCFQDVAQVRARYGERAATVINNHRTRVVLSGLADPSTSDLLGSLVGTTNHRREGGRGIRMMSEPRTSDRRLLIEPYEIRGMPQYCGVVVSGRLPPARLVLRPYN